MGTRNLTCVMYNGEYRVAQYCQWDGYPSGQGAIALNFLSDKEKLAALRRNISLCRFISKEEYDRLWTDMGLPKSNDGWVSCEDANKFKSKYPQLDRDMGASVLDFIANSTDIIRLQSDINFVKDSLFCEWAYVIDFDKNTFEVYKGFNNMPLDKSERFYSGTPNKDKYYPVKLVVSYSLDALPTLEEFLNDSEPSDEDE